MTHKKPKPAAKPKTGSKAAKKPMPKGYKSKMDYK